jgi:hypothetical protein
VTGGWRQLHNEELHNLHTSPDISMIISERMSAGHVARTGAKIYLLMQFLVGEAASNRPTRQSTIYVYLPCDRTLFSFSGPNGGVAFLP